ncbi:MAG: AURKAIP1/COX24 domain-containing protein [Deltaproteobacteria bacterium]|nr:AURKAIP1/COX24 domain-containing protein [Deltaproteobacteria bacterium]
MGNVLKKRRKKMRKHKHKKLLAQNRHKRKR